MRRFINAHVYVFIIKPKFKRSNGTFLTDTLSSKASKRLHIKAERQYDVSDKTVKRTMYVAIFIYPQ